MDRHVEFGRSRKLSEERPHHLTQQRHIDSHGALQVAQFEILNVGSVADFGFRVWELSPLGLRVFGLTLRRQAGRTGLCRDALRRQR